MATHGEISDFGARGMARVMRYIGTHPLVLTGIALNAVSFIAFIALLSVAELSLAVPATATSYILKTALAQWYLGEDVSRKRWAGAVMVAVGVYLIAT
jgi:drug/metabolite transporter (DMT)-like permease